MKFEEGPPSDAAVAQALSALKREGGSVLVLGAAHAGHTDVCQRFLGGDAERVLVSTDGSVHCDAEPAAVVERPVQTRSAATATPTASPTSLDSLNREVRSTFRDLDEEGTRLRLCFDSLRPYVDATPEPELVSFLATLRETAREADAVVHVHLPAMADAVPEALTGAVDAVVELNRQGGSTYQQWRLPGEEATSEWVSV
jgi:KaiC/GvpD/RAD55 family RecA-like ATPase